MIDTHKHLQEVLDEFFKLQPKEKMLLLDDILFSFTISGRGIWSDDEPSDKEKVEALKWLNELSHRIWNIKHELTQGEDKDSSVRLFENLKFYGEQSALLQVNIVPAILLAYKAFKDRA